MFSPTLPQKSECLVVPLDPKLLPHKTHLSRTDKTQNSLIFNLDLLKSKQQSFKTNHRLDWQKILSAHLHTNPKLTTKPMHEFGIGAFSLSKIFKRELVIYPGQMVDSNVTVNLPLQERIYYLRVPNTELCIDPKYTDCIAKYFQHLPKPDEHTVIDLDDEIPALDNFESDMAYVDIYVENDCYTIPVRVLVAKQDIEAGSIVGFDYGKKYWSLLKKTFTCFTRDGIPINSYCFNVDDYKYIVSPTTFLRLIDNGFSISKERFLFLPDEVRQALKLTRMNDNSGSQVFTIQALGEFNLNKCLIIYKKTEGEQQPVSVLIKLPDQMTLVHSKPIFAKFADNVNYKVPAPIQAFSIQLLLTASLKDLSELRDKLCKVTHSRFMLRMADESLPELIEEVKQRADQKLMIYSLFDQWIFKKDRVEKPPALHRSLSPKL